MPESINISWNRLESSTRHENFERSLRCEVRDPLWMLSRQWQMGEFQAQDSGSPVFAAMKWHTTKLAKVALNQNEAIPFDKDLPLETEVERVQFPVETDLSLAAEMGRYWTRLLRQKLTAVTSRWPAIIEAYKSNPALLFQLPPEASLTEQYQHAPQLSNTPYLQMLHAMIQGSMLNGAKLYLLLKEENAVELIEESEAAVINALNEAGAEFVAWFDQQYAQPVNENKDAWKPERLEYQAACAAPALEKEPEILQAREYYHGHLDWYNFDRSTRELGIHGDSLSRDLDQSIIEHHKKVLIPSQIEYTGMPNSRWWTFENREIEFGNIQAQTTELAKLVFAEYGMIYSNDWFGIPLEIPAGSLAVFEEITVTDVFGQKTLIEHYGKNNEENQHWGLFQLRQLDASSETPNSPYDHSLFIPSVAHSIQEGKPVEQIHFIRDELANMAWGIETIVPDLLGRGVNGRDSIANLQAFYKKLEARKTNGLPVDSGSTTDDPDAPKIKYQLANSVPENWIPFLPVRLPGDGNSYREKIANRFQRAALPRVLKGFDPSRIRPRSHLLRWGFNEATNSPIEPYFIQEEEIPRSGLILQASWQRTRWYNGKIVLWYGYQKTNGRGEGSNNLQFDQVVDKKISPH